MLHLARAVKHTPPARGFNKIWCAVFGQRSHDAIHRSHRAFVRLIDGSDALQRKSRMTPARALGAVSATDGRLDFSNVRARLLFCNGTWCDQSPRAIRNLVEADYQPNKLFYYRSTLSSPDRIRTGQHLLARNAATELAPPISPLHFAQAAGGAFKFEHAFAFDIKHFGRCRSGANQAHMRLVKRINQRDEPLGFVKVRTA